MHILWVACNPGAALPTGATSDDPHPSLVKLALLMWRHTANPLRAALIGKRICVRLRQEVRRC